jgi:acyl dehydratase
MDPSLNPRFFEDYSVGQVSLFGPIAVSEKEIVEFAQRFDPQPMHTDPVAASEGAFGGLIASGWHTASLMMRLYATDFLSVSSSLASPGVDELRWIEPVRPGDNLTMKATVLETRRSRSKPDRGLLRVQAEVINQHERTVMTVILMSMVATRSQI